MIGDEIRKARLSAGMSQERLAERAGLHRTYISDIERGVKCPTVAVFLRVCSALGVSVSALLKRVEDLGKR